MHDVFMTKEFFFRFTQEVAVMYGVVNRDIRTVAGSNMALLVSETGLDPIHANLGDIRKQLYSKVVRVPDMDKWRLDYLAKLLTQRVEALYRVNSSEVQRLTNLINSLCTN